MVFSPSMESSYGSISVEILQELHPHEEREPPSPSTYNAPRSDISYKTGSLDQGKVQHFGRISKAENQSTVDW